MNREIKREHTHSGGHKKRLLTTEDKFVKVRFMIQVGYKKKKKKKSELATKTKDLFYELNVK